MSDRENQPDIRLNLAFGDANMDISRLFPAPDQPLYIHTIMERYQELPPDQSAEIILHLLLRADGLSKTLRFRIPSGSGEPIGPDSTAARYLLARLNNLLVTFGGIRLTIYSDRSNSRTNRLIQETLAHFDLERPKNNRTGIGSIINYINRINQVTGAPAFEVALRDLAEFSDAGTVNEYRLPCAPDRAAADHILQAAATELSGKAFLGLDIGGNSIKGAVVEDGQVVLLKTYAWFPALFTEADDLVGPIIQLARFFARVTAYWKSHDRTLPELAPFVFDECASLDEILANLDDLGLAGAMPGAQEHDAQEHGAHEQGACEPGRDMLAADPALRIFDGVVAGFPDIIVANKIAGGETYKQRGIRHAHPEDYACELARMATLDEALGTFVKPGGIVKMLNDGSLASFVVSVEQSFDPESSLDQYGLFAFTIGTEMGAGYISRLGSVLEMPLECYNYIIDLGNDAYMDYHENDVRSIRNFNTRIPGTVQKYVSQTGLIRLALQGMARQSEPTLQQLIDHELLSYDPESDRLQVRSEPIDCRGPLTRQLIDWLVTGSESVRQAYREIGTCLGVVIDEVRLLFPELSPHKFLSGGLVNEPDCFRTLCDSLSRYNPAYGLRRLDTARSFVPLLKTLSRQQANYTVAVGACFLANRILNGEPDASCYCQPGLPEG